MNKLSKILSNTGNKSKEYKNLLEFMRFKGIIDDKTYRKISVKRAVKRYCNN